MIITRTIDVDLKGYYNMKTNRHVCIVTWYGTDNYGSNLQAFGLSAVLNKQGYDVSFFGGFKVHSFLIKHPLLIFARIINRLNNKKRNSFFNPIPYVLSNKRKNRLEKFKHEYFNTVIYQSSAQWKKAIMDKTIFVSGSDILWNPALGYPTSCFLDFAYYAKLSRFSYASSVGALELPKKYYKAYRRYLGSMKAVGVREESVKKMLEPIIKREVTQVVDPTLLLSKDDWLAFSESAKLSVPISDNGFILCYFVMNDKRYWNYVKSIAQVCNKQIIVLPMHKLDEEQPYDIIMDGTPPEFVWLINNADFVCTDSFHACVISSILHKEFYLLRRTRKAENAKYDDFLNRYGLSDRSVSDESEFKYKHQTDYSIFDQKIQDDRKRAMCFLKSALVKCKSD